VKVARLAQTFGIGARMDDNRVYMQFARAAYENKDIVLKTQGLSVGNYCAADDAVNAIFTILEKGVDGEIYNVVNEENTMCIRDMAELVASEIAHGKISVVVETEDSGKTGYAADTALRMSGEKLRHLGWKPTKNLVQMYRDLVTELEKNS
jgi:nucleoside-diphosphate-sugar epimerase